MTDSTMHPERRKSAPVTECGSESRSHYRWLRRNEQARRAPSRARSFSAGQRMAMQPTWYAESSTAREATRAATIAVAFATVYRGVSARRF